MVDGQERAGGADLGRTAPVLILVVDRRVCGERGQGALYVVAVVSILVALNHVRDLCSHVRPPIRRLLARITRLHAWLINHRTSPREA